MKTPLTTAVRVIATLCPFSPMATEVYSRFREPQQVLCPEEGEYATVQVDAEMLAATAAVGMPGLRNYSVHAVASRLWSRLPGATQLDSRPSLTSAQLTWRAHWRRENNG